MNTHKKFLTSAVLSTVDANVYFIIFQDISRLANMFIQQSNILLSKIGIIFF